MINQIKKFLKNDKILHMICCFAIVVIFVLNVVSGIALALIASFGKEAYDEVRPNGSGWSWDDILADLLGIVLGILIL